MIRTAAWEYGYSTQWKRRRSGKTGILSSNKYQRSHRIGAEEADRDYNRLMRAIARGGRKDFRL